MLTHFQRFKIPLAFLVTGIIWITVSDQIFRYLDHTWAFLSYAKLKGLNEYGFVIVIAFVLYFEINRQQRTLRQSEEEYRYLFEANPNPMWIYNTRTLKFLRVNAAALNKYGFSREEFLAMTILDIRSADDGKLLRYINEHKDDFKTAGIWQHKKKNGQEFKVNITSHVIAIMGQKCSFVMATDISDIIDKEQALENAYKQIKDVNETLLKISWSVSHELRKPLCSILGLITVVQEAKTVRDIKQCVQLLKLPAEEMDQLMRSNSQRIAEVNVLEPVKAS